MEMEIRRAVMEEYPMVRAFYHSLIDGMGDSEFNIGWIKDIYPSPEFLRESIAGGELFIGLEYVEPTVFGATEPETSEPVEGSIGSENHRIAAAMVLNHQSNDGYKEFQWPTKAADSEVTVIHALGVHPMYKGKGYAKQMVRKAFAEAGKNSQKAIRLDVLKGNVPAEKLYTGLGFRYLHTLNMYYEDTGWTEYELYEYQL